MTLFLRFICLAFFMCAAPAYAEDGRVPEMPKTLQTMMQQGAQVRYLGRDNGLDGWITIFRGQEQYFYVTPDRKATVMGLLFDENGKMVTVDQVGRLQQQGGEVLEMLAVDKAESEETQASVSEAFKKYKSPAERMFDDVESSNWIKLGNPDAPVLYSFVDPQCPHCHAFIKDIRKDYIDAGRIQVRLVPVGFNAQSLAQASFLLAAPNPEESWFEHLDGDETALPAKSEVSDQGVQRNMAIMQAWNFDVTPMNVYQSRSGEIKIVRGKAKNMTQIMADMPAR